MKNFKSKKKKKSNARLGSTRQPFKGCIADGCTKVHKEGYSGLFGKKKYHLLQNVMAQHHEEDDIFD